MRSMNKVFLLGRVGQDLELQTTKKGQPYTRFSLATHRSWKDENDKLQEVTDWHNVTVWGSEAKICHRGVTKGSLLLVEGELSPYQFVNEAGVKEFRQSITARKVNFISLKKGISAEESTASA